MPRTRNADRICSTPTCNRPVRCRDLCNICYHRAVVSRSIAALPLQSLEERFWSKVNKDGPTMAHMTSACWEWTAQMDGKRYGRFYDGERQTVATRMSWRINRGPIGDSLMVCHRCDNPPCVNPDHLFLGTARDNIHDMHAKGRHADVALTRRRGEDNGNAHLTADQVREIRAAYASRSETQAGLAARFGMTQGAVNKITQRKTWKHLV